MVLTAEPLSVERKKVLLGTSLILRKEVGMSLMEGTVCFKLSVAMPDLDLWTSVR